MKSINIKTTQNVIIEYELANLKTRAIALLIDTALFCLCYIVFLNGLFSLHDGGLSNTFFYTFLPITLFIIYITVQEYLMFGQTVGKKMMNIQVIRIDGKEISLSNILLRAVFLFIDYAISLGTIGAIMISSTPNSQRLGDLVAQMCVINLKSFGSFTLEDILQIQTLSSYTPKYPNVLIFSESDMLLFKNVLMRYSKYKNENHRKALITAVEVASKAVGLEEPAKNKEEFLKVLIKDYIVLTR